MSLEIGQEYFYLTAAQHAAVHDVFGDACTFFEGPDGYWYCQSLDEEIYVYLLEEELLQSTVYSKSTQPGANM